MSTPNNNDPANPAEPTGDDAEEYLNAVSETSAEWSSPEDEQAYSDLQNIGHLVCAKVPTGPS